MSEELPDLPEDLFSSGEEVPVLAHNAEPSELIVINNEDLPEEEVIVIGDDDLEEIPDPEPQPSRKDPVTELVCPYCHTKFEPNDEIVACSTCNSPHHKGCWETTNKCSILGCSGRNHVPYINSNDEVVI